MMSDMVLFLASNPWIKEIVLVLGVGSNPALVCDICRVMHLERLVIASPTPTLEKEIKEVIETFGVEERFNMPDEIVYLSSDKVADYKAKYDSLALVFDALKSDSTVIDLKRLKPRYLVGTLCKDDMNAFALWEAYRTVAEQIYLVSWKHGDEVLNWKRDEACDTELSVIFPVYNIAAYLPKCIESIMEWQADYVEYLFVDDGSPDNSADIIREYEKKDSRIHLLQKENGGCASARQFGLSRAKGRYVGFIDPDDYIDPTMFRKLLARALIGSYEISYCGYNELYEETGEIKEIDDILGWPYCDGTSDPKHINELIAYRRIAIWRGIYLREMIERSGIHFYEDIRRFDDLPFKVETLAKARSVVAVPEYLYYYRMSRPGQDVSADDERLYVHFPIFNYLDTFLRNCADRRQLDYLQVVKIQTHHWALKKIKNQYFNEYCRQARKDLLSNFGFWEGYYILHLYAGREDRAYYTAICTGAYGLAKLMARPRKAKRSKNDEAIDKLKKLTSSIDRQ